MKVFNIQAQSAVLTAVALSLSLFSQLSDASRGQDWAAIRQCQWDRNLLSLEIRNDLNNLEVDTDFTLAVKTASGRTFTHSIGDSNEFVSYESASTSKMVTAAIILSVVESNLLSLDDHPQDYLSFWPKSGNISRVELNHLLNFTSGLTNGASCVDSPNADFEQCVRDIAKKNRFSIAPGTQFYYSSNHLQVAGLMAVKASGLSSWQELFEQYQAQTGLFLNASYDLPSESNPRLAGGMHWNANEYLHFLGALHNGQVLTADLRQQMMSDQLNGAPIDYSPVQHALGEDWHYGFGNWMECHDLPFNCGQVTTISSPGAYGAYPFINFEYQYYGIVARQGALGTFKEGYQLFQSVSAKMDEWASMSCQ